MNIGEQIHIKEGLEAHRMRIMNVDTVTSLALEQEVMRNEEVLDMIKKVGSMVIIEGVQPVLKLLMIGVEMIDLEMEGDRKIVERLMEI